MSAFSGLDSSLQAAGSSLLGSVSGGGILGGITSGLQVKIYTNLTPPFTVGGLATDSGITDPATGKDVQAATPGLLSALGLKYSVSVLDAGGTELVHAGDPPPTDYLVLAAWAAALGTLGFLLYRGVRSFF
jgi:hypothetical protein